MAQSEKWRPKTFSRTARGRCLHQKESPSRLQPSRASCSVQLRLDSTLTLVEYISQRAWLDATLPSCPVHGSGCRPAGNGYYWRKYPEPLAIARFYCAAAHTSFSLLPDFLSSRYRGTLAEFEEVCALIESSDCLEIANTVTSIEVASNISERSAARWVARRIFLFNAVLLALLGVLGQQLQGVRTAVQLRQRLQCPADSTALVVLRGIVVANLAALAPPLGFGPWPKVDRRHPSPRPHTMGPEPPASKG